MCTAAASVHETSHCVCSSCCCNINVMQAAVHLDQLAVACAILQPDKLLLDTLCAGR